MQQGSASPRSPVQGRGVQVPSQLIHYGALRDVIPEDRKETQTPAVTNVQTGTAASSSRHKRETWAMESSEQSLIVTTPWAISSLAVNALVVSGFLTAAVFLSVSEPLQQ